MEACPEVRMSLYATPPAHPTAAWIQRYAAGLLSSTPRLQPLDAVRMAMDACEHAHPSPSVTPVPPRGPGGH
jgi:hypothetical protein